MSWKKDYDDDNVNATVIVTQVFRFHLQTICFEYSKDLAFSTLHHDVIFLLIQFCRRETKLSVSPLRVLAGNLKAKRVKFIRNFTHNFVQQTVSYFLGFKIFIKHSSDTSS